MNEADWLAGFPDEWRELRADFLCYPYREVVSPERFEGEHVAHYSIPQVQDTGGPLIEPADDIDSTKLLIRQPTLLVSKLNPRKKTICIAEPRGDLPTLASGEFVPIQSDKFDQRYAFYLWSSEKVTDRLSAIVQSATRSHQRVNPSDILKLPWKWPSLETQKRIAAFLNEKTARIDGLIEKKRALLDRLAEKRQAIITQAVTKGLNPDVPMKDSGIDWLGQIPAHWDVKRLKFIGETILGLTYSPSDVVDEGEGLLVLRSSNVQNGKLTRDDNVFVETNVPDELIVRSGDILVCSRNGSRALIGKNAVITDEYAGQTFGAFMTVFRTPMHRFIHLVFNSELFAFQSGRFMTSTINQLTVNAIKDFAVPVPPKSEQREIADAVNLQLARLDQIAADVATSTDRLTEYRSALITAAVTGQIEELR